MIFLTQYVSIYKSAYTKGYVINLVLSFTVA